MIHSFQQQIRFESKLEQTTGQYANSILYKADHS